MGEAIGRIVKTILDALTPIITPDWGGLVGMLPIFLVLGVVGPILSLLILGWVIYVLRAPRAANPVCRARARPGRRSSTASRSIRRASRTARSTSSSFRPVPRRAP